MDDDEHGSGGAARLARAIAEPARARILYRLMDGRAQTSTELAIVADVSPATASSHLKRLTEAGLVRVSAEGKYRHYSLANRDVARLLERLSVVAAGPRRPPEARVPRRMRMARTCFDHIAGEVGVALNDRFHTLGWLHGNADVDGAYELSDAGSTAFRALGIDVAAARALRRRFAYGCLDWSERRAHLAGALGAAVLKIALERKWVICELDSRALEITRKGVTELSSRFGVTLGRSA